MTPKQISIIGATGQVGTPLTQTLLAEGHSVRILTRSDTNDRLREYKGAGAEIKLCPDMRDTASIASAIEGSDTLICATPASETIITEFEPAWLEAAKQAGVGRFVPTEFGAHTQNLNYGDGVLFDHKKRLHEKIFESGVGWTFYYNGGIFDYFLPNLRFFEEITTFGDIDIPIYTHAINDIGRIAALSLTDDRTLNRCVQMDYQKVTQREMLNVLNEAWPDYPFIFKHYSSAYITKMMGEAGADVSAKQGAETDEERWGINNVIYVLGKLAAFTDETVRTSELFPDFVYQDAKDAIADPSFVFEQKVS